MLQPQKVKFKYLFEKSYLAYIKNSVGTKMFRNFFVVENKKVRDVLGNGDLSCAVFVSTILRNFGLTKKLHFTVARTAEDLQACGAKKITVKNLKPGDVLIWLPEKGKSGMHNHIGFYVGDDTAISNSDKSKMIAQHHITFKGKRNIEFALRPNWKHAQS